MLGVFNSLALFMLYPSSCMFCQDEAALRALTIEDEEEGTTHSRPAPFTRYDPSHHARESCSRQGSEETIFTPPARFLMPQDNNARQKPAYHAT